jgi:hypothetical protein
MFQVLKSKEGQFCELSSQFKGVAIASEKHKFENSVIYTITGCTARQEQAIYNIAIKNRWGRKVYLQDNNLVVDKGWDKFVQLDMEGKEVERSYYNNKPEDRTVLDDLKIFDKSEQNKKLIRELTTTELNTLKDKTSLVKNGLVYSIKITRVKQSEDKPESVDITKPDPLAQKQAQVQTIQGQATALSNQDLELFKQFKAFMSQTNKGV